MNSVSALLWISAIGLSAASIFGQIKYGNDADRTDDTSSGKGSSGQGTDDALPGWLELINSVLPILWLVCVIYWVATTESNIDFELVLVVATLVTSVVWLLDLVWLRRRRAEQAASEGRAAKEPVLVEYSAAFAPILLVVLILRSFIAEPFKIPSNSMMPTLLTGDFILVNKFAYGMRLPVWHTKILATGEPERGDVAVFRWPGDPSVDYIKRIVAVPGDTVMYRYKTLYVNGEKVPQRHEGLFSGVGSSAEMNGVEQREENLSGVEHKILVDPTTHDWPPRCRLFANGPVTVPEGKYLAMGDNRDRSEDSRCWGWVPEENLAGPAFMIWFNYDRKYGDLHFSRIGTLID